MEPTLAARLFYRYHRYYWLGLRLAYVAGGGRAAPRLPLHRLRDLALALDAALSLGRLVCLLGTPVAVMLACLLGAWTPAAAALLACAAAAGLDRLELREQRANRLRPFSIFNINTGSARTLVGEVEVRHLLLNVRGLPWSNHDVADVLGRARQATGWLERQARLASVTLRFHHRVLPARVWWAGPVPSQANGYARLQQLVARVRAAAGAVVGARNVCVMVHAPVTLRSYAVPHSLGRRYATPPLNPDPLELCVLGAEKEPSVHAHELLHLFGADDYYGHAWSMLRLAREQLIGRSVMFAGEALPLEQQRVDGVTAQNVGWC